MALPKVVLHQSRSSPSRPPKTASSFRSTIPISKAHGTARSRLPLYCGGVLVYGITVYAGYRYFSLDSQQSVDAEPKDNLSLSKHEVYDDIAATYDAEIGFDETLMGLNWLRWFLLRQAQGDVLEASCGTGRNTAYYKPAQLHSITFVDQSPQMMELCEAKWRKCASARAKVPATFKAQQMEGLSSNREQYDTIVQTFGLCSVADPSGYLSHLASFLRPTGTIMLLEHGRSKYAFINRILDRSVDQHAQKWGCYYNRDIDQIINNCPELVVVKQRRFHFGTTYMTQLRLRDAHGTENRLPTTMS